MPQMTILVATDFSKNADHALARAVSLTKEKNAKLIILHVAQKKLMDTFLDVAFKNVLPKGFCFKTEKYKESVIQEKIQALSAELEGIEYVLLTKGKPAVKILQYAKKHKVDLLILGAHGHYSVRETFVDTTAEHVAKKTHIPVLIVKNRQHANYKNIMVSIDFSKVSKKALNYALPFFPESQVSLIYVGDYEYGHLLKRVDMDIPKSKASQIKKSILLSFNNKMKTFIKDIKKNPKKLNFNIVCGYPGLSIVKESVKINADLIVMGTQGHGREHYQLIGSVANWVLTNTKKDLLLVPG